MKRKNKTKEGEEETKGIVNTISKTQDLKEIQNTRNKKEHNWKAKDKCE